MPLHFAHYEYLTRDGILFEKKTYNRTCPQLCRFCLQAIVQLNVVTICYCFLLLIHPSYLQMLQMQHVLKRQGSIALSHAGSPKRYYLRIPALRKKESIGRNNTSMTNKLSFVLLITTCYLSAFLIGGRKQFPVEQRILLEFMPNIC